MAGAGYRLFATGDVLTAAQVNTYLQQQTVMVFADSSARTTALSGVVAEGMVSYLQSDDTVYVYNGSAWVSIANSGDITSVVAGNGLSGGATSGAATLTIDTAITVDKTTSQTLTNKTLTSPIISSISNTGTLTLPTSTDTLVGRATTDTLTNKTLTSPALTTPTISTLTTNGDLVYGTGSGALSRLGIGSTGNVLTVASGIPSWSAPAGGGKMLQVVNVTYNTSTVISSTSYTDSGLSGSITPTLNTSKILVIITQNGRLNLNTNYNYVSSKLLRDATAITTYADNYLAGSFTGPTAVYVGGLNTWTWLDSPATTSSTTYKTQYKLQHTTNSNFTCQSDSVYSTMTLIEVGA